MATVSLRHLLQILDPSTYPPGTDTHVHRRIRNRRFFSRLYNGGRGNPVDTFKDLISAVDSIPLEHSLVPGVMEDARTSPFILPYLPALGSDQPRAVFRSNRKDFAKAYHSVCMDLSDTGSTKLEKIMYWISFGRPRSPALHSQCVVGTLEHNGEQFWIARQTWKNCWVTIIPVMSTEELVAEMKKQGLNVTPEIAGRLTNLNQALFPLKTGTKPGISQDPLAFEAGPAVYSGSTPLSDSVILSGTVSAL